MILPARAFDDFCAHNGVSFIGEQQRAPVDESWDWRLHDATHKRFR